ncbi:MAG: Type 1 glutamine amidotransferase-like domain-containing protein, partial [Bacteroidota bacterium]
MRLIVNLFLLFLVFSTNKGFAQDATTSEEKIQPILSSGPDKGRLLLLGGGISEKQMKLFQKFSGGKDSTIIVIPTALSDEEISKDPSFDKVKRRFSKLGVSNIKILHTRNKDTANSDVFVKPILEVKGIFILGGKTQRIVDAYLNTKTHEAMKNLLARDGIIAGVSAGSGCQAAYFTENGLEIGFEFLEGAIVLNHFIAKNKQFRYAHEINQNRQRITIGIDDYAGILVQGEKFEVIGPSYVAIYDRTDYDRYNDSISVLPLDSERFYFLQNGDRYNLNKRQVESNSRLSPIELSPKDLAEYTGNYKAKHKNFEIDFMVEDNVLKVKNSWGWSIYPIYPLEADVFYATNRNMWFKFIRVDTEIV